MIRNKNFKHERIDVWYFAVLIAFVLLMGSAWYLINLSNQIEEKKKLEIAEYRINLLNEIYVNFLKAVNENRGYRLYSGAKRNEKYLVYRNKADSLLKQYPLDPKISQDSSLFTEIRKLISKRVEDLDKLLLFKQTNLRDFRLPQELEQVDLNATLLEEKMELLLNYWKEQSQQASNQFDIENTRNDKLFLGWVLVTILLFVLLILNIRKKINSRIQQQITEETLELVQRKEQEFSAAFDYASIGMALVSVEGKWLRVNKSLCQILGYTAEEMLAITFQDITHPDDLNADLQYVEQMLRKEIDTYQMEKRYYTKEGRLVWVLLSVSLVWENQQPKYFISQIKDITARKLLQEQLESEKSRLQQVIEGTDAGTWEWNVQTGETIFNEKWAQMIDYTLAELEPISIDTWIKFAHPDDLELSNLKLQDYFEGKTEQYVCVCRMKHKSGEWIWVMRRGKVMTWTEDGKPEWMFGSHINITSMKQLEESLELERKKYTSIFNSTFQFIGFLDLDGTLLEANETALNFAGLQQADVIGKKYWDCHWWQISKETQEQLKEAIQKAKKGEEVSYEVAVWDSNKKPQTILFHLKPLRNQHGNVAYIIPEGTLIQDMIDYRTMLEAKNQELEGFAAIAAHDLKEPLRMISNFMERLAKKYEGQLDEVAQKYIYLAADGANRMNNLINDLLAYAEIGGAREDAFEMVDLNEVFEEACRLKAALIEEKNAKVSKVTLPAVKAHKTAMLLLFQNLISNGLKYQAQGNQPILEINVSEIPTGYRFSFKDNGIGISKENYNKVFRLFSRLHAKSEYEGTGMGLATSKKIATMHGGDIWLESTPGQGTTFYFTLPKNSINQS